MLTCLRIGLTGRPDDTPEDSLTELLRRLEGNGAAIVSVSVVKPGTLPGEQFEAYLVIRERAGVVPT